MGAILPGFLTTQWTVFMRRPKKTVRECHLSLYRFYFTCSGLTIDTIRYLSLHDNQYVRYFKGHKDKVTQLEVSPTDDMFISASCDHSVRLWDLRSPNCHVSVLCFGLLIQHSWFVVLMPGFIKHPRSCTDDLWRDRHGVCCCEPKRPNNFILWR
jgi:WD40 repeat protein